jgi:hypothetical protein
MQRFEELCDLIVIERDLENFSALVTAAATLELNVIFVGATT